MFRAELRLIEYPGNILHCSLEKHIFSKIKIQKPFEEMSKLWGR